MTPSYLHPSSVQFGLGFCQYEAKHCDDWQEYLRVGVRVRCRGRGSVKGRVKVAVSRMISLRVTVRKLGSGLGYPSRVKSHVVPFAAFVVLLKTPPPVPLLHPDVSMSVDTGEPESRYD